MRIAIAEACGWKRNAGDTSPSWSKTFSNPDIKQTIYYTEDELPDYLNDLNAIHEAEKLLDSDDEVRGEYENILYNNGSYYSTAWQRSEAFLLALGMWKD